jgi:hypothetical protein
MNSLASAWLEGAVARDLLAKLPGAAYI